MQEAKYDCINVSSVCSIVVTLVMTLCYVITVNALKSCLKSNGKERNSIVMKLGINSASSRKRFRVKIQQSTIIWKVFNSLGSDWSLETLISRFSYIKF